MKNIIYKIRFSMERIINMFRKRIIVNWKKYDVRFIQYTETMRNGQRREHRFTISGNQITLCLIEDVIRKQRWVSDFKVETLKTESEMEILQGTAQAHLNSSIYAHTLLEARKTLLFGKKE